MEVENKLKSMGLELPTAGTAPPGRAGAVKVGNLLFVGGHTPGADFRGKHKSLYNYLSAPGLSINVRLEEALYTLRDGQLLVNGTFMTESHVATLVAGETQVWALLPSPLDP